MTDQHLEAALAVIAAAERGDYDDRLGIGSDERAALNRAADSGPLTIADIAELRRINRPDLIADAYDAGRINLNPNGA